MVEKRVSQIKVHMEAKSTEELLGIWTKNDRAEWSDSAFEAVRLVLEDRHVELPEQNRDKSPSPDMDRKTDHREAKVVLGTVLVIFSLLCLAIPIAAIIREGPGILTDAGRAVVLALFVLVPLVLMAAGIRVIRRNCTSSVDHTPEQELRKHQTRETVGAVLALVGVFILLSAVGSFIATRDTAEPLSARIVISMLIFTTVSIALIASGVRIVLRHHRIIAPITRQTPRAPVPPPYLTASGTVQLAPNYTISPRDHSVADASRAFRRYTATGASRLAIYPVLGLIGSVVAFILFLVTRQLDLNTQIPSFVRIGTSMLTWFLFCAAVLALPYSLFAVGRCLCSACVRPDLSTPEKTVKCFLQSIRVNLRERAYDVLTDQARNLGKVDLTEAGHSLSNRIPEVVISDFSSFQRWWAWANVRVVWPLAWDEMTRYDVSSDVCILEIPVWVAYPVAGPERLHFKAVFPLLQRHNAWFVATPFIWPFVSL